SPGLGLVEGRCNPYRLRSKSREPIPDQASAQQRELVFPDVRRAGNSKTHRIVAPSTAVLVPPPCCVKRGRTASFCGRRVNRLSVLRWAHTRASPGKRQVTAASCTSFREAIALRRCLSH